MRNRRLHPQFPTPPLSSSAIARRPRHHLAAALVHPWSSTGRCSPCTPPDDLLRCPPYPDQGYNRAAAPVRPATAGGPSSHHLHLVGQHISSNTARRPHHRLYGDAPEPLPSLLHYGPLHQPDPSTSGAAFACLRHLRQNLFGPMISGSMDHVWTDVILNCRCSWRVAAILVGRIYARPRSQSIHCTSV
ncbi:uncharacterized protein [Aegilops tauschii subsp. strangulata]|uniref:uncharacterized protein n=1 Tax=Aegilops tauschii subsp. strangulata TaxID=200361 RepID=UPI003CC8C115